MAATDERCFSTVGQPYRRSELNQPSKDVLELHRTICVQELAGEGGLLSRHQQDASTRRPEERQVLPLAITEDRRTVLVNRHPGRTIPDVREHEGPRHS